MVSDPACPYIANVILVTFGIGHCGITLRFVMVVIVMIQRPVELPLTSGRIEIEEDVKSSRGQGSS